ncbi:hypothetical protein HNR45_001446 [Negativicoccus succinicivorans]|uniref:MobA/MobL protein domain-containing protein n=4 Tax=Negativicoccus succinicivorans TaxID=620903 RepID=A0A841R5D0_9FIRM|nr:MobA/MobL family protein [Negativicoccus succinicivorans]MBB6478367.1 hypothetical protein [Negativicoccus succinicivorans]
MALYRLSSKIGKSGTATSHYNYIAREGKYKKGTKKEDLVYKESKNLPTWANEKAAVFWKECSENYRKIELALPLELSSRDQIILTRKFCEKTFGDDFVYSFAIHENVGVLSGKRNPHAHILFSERKIERNRPEPNRENWFKKSRTRKDGTISGGYRKDKTITGTNRKNWLLNIRKRWEVLQNKALMITGSLERVDCRRKVEYAPESLIPAQIHLGAKRARMRAGEVWNEYQAIKAMPAVVAELKQVTAKEHSKTQKLGEISGGIEKVTAELQKARQAEIEAKNRKLQELRNEQIELMRSVGDDSDAAADLLAVDGTLLEYAPERLRNSPRVVKAALKQNPAAVKFIGARLQERMAEIEGNLTPLEKIIEIRKENWREYQRMLKLEAEKEAAAAKSPEIVPEAVPVEVEETAQRLAEQGQTAHTNTLAGEEQTLKRANFEDKKIEIVEKEPEIEPEPKKETLPVPTSRSAGTMISSSRNISTGETTTLYSNGTVRIAGELYEIADVGEIKGAEHGLLGTKYEVRLPNGVTFKVNEKVWAQSKQAVKGLDKGRGGFSIG